MGFLVAYRVMRIGIDLRNVGKQRTGDETVFFHLTRELARMGTPHTFRLFVDNRTPEELEILAERLEIRGREHFSFVSIETSGRFHWNAVALPRALRQDKLDIYHTQYITPFFVPGEVALVTHIHDVSFAAYPQYIGWKDRLFLDLLIPRSLRAARAVVAVSEFTRAEITKYYGTPAEKIRVVPNALGDDYLSYRPTPEDAVRIRERYRLPGQFLLYVGTLQPRKNIPQLIRAFARVADRLPEVQLVLVGTRSGHHFDTGIDRAIGETGLGERVVFPGYVDQVDLPGVIRLAELCVFPTVYEGFGIPLLEAMSQDVPVVSADIPCLREVAGDAAIFADSGNLALFGEALYNGFTRPKKRVLLQELGRKRVTHYSWRLSAEKLVSVYESLGR